jgi:hypothetical protein
MPNITVINEATAVTDDVVEAMLPALSQQWNRDLRPIWGLDQANFSFVKQGQAPVAGTWWVVFLDDSDQADALAYHDLTNEGLPISKVFAKTIQADKASLSVGATHEICEMAVDPWLNSAYQDPPGVFWAGEVCDPVEDHRYAYQIGDTLVTDFVTPNWFGHQHAQGPIDFEGHSRAAFEILTGGLRVTFRPATGLGADYRPSGAPQQACAAGEGLTPRAPDPPIEAGLASQRAGLAALSGRLKRGSREQGSAASLGQTGTKQFLLACELSHKTGAGRCGQDAARSAASDVPEEGLE